MAAAMRVLIDQGKRDKAPYYEGRGGEEGDIHVEARRLNQNRASTRLKSERLVIVLRCPGRCPGTVSASKLRGPA